ncbi:hypothetical protein AGMMS49975_19660 [Clostridia bacterium]|nr:hypothetical protein AGMMS49975_19660 [Clostridia bacterium]
MSVGINTLRYKSLVRGNEYLQTEISRLKASNESRTPIIWENRDSERIFRDYERLDKKYKELFTFGTLEDMA